MTTVALTLFAASLMTLFASLWVLRKAHRACEHASFIVTRLAEVTYPERRSAEGGWAGQEKRSSE